MPEIKHAIEQATEGETHVFGPGEYLITEEHTLADILRFAISQAGDKDEIIMLLEHVD